MWTTRSLIPALIGLGWSLLLAGCMPAPGSGVGQSTATSSPASRTPTTVPASVAEATPDPSPALPEGWTGYRSGIGFTFACPPDWEVALPGSGDAGGGPPSVGLAAPAASYPGGNRFSMAWAGYEIAPGQSLEEWIRLVFLASGDGMVPPREILRSDRLPAAEPGGESLRVIELAGPGTGWQRLHVYQAHGSAVLELRAEVMPEESRRAAAVLADIAATIRFLAPGAAQAGLYVPHGRSLTGVGAAATAAAAATPEARCDVVCQDATAAAGITPGPMKTYPPAMATREKQYYDRLLTATAQALTTTPTPSPSATPTPTPQPAAQPGMALVHGRSSGGPLTPGRSYQLIYDLAEWQERREHATTVLAHRRLASCALIVQPGGRGMGGPVLSEQTVLSNLPWRSTYWLYDGSISYRPSTDGSDLWFELEVGKHPSVDELRLCRAAAEAVLATLTFAGE